jgi:hypothetical protein
MQKKDKRTSVFEIKENIDEGNTCSQLYHCQVKKSLTPVVNGIGQNGQILYRKKGMEHCVYMVCGSKKIFVPFVNYEPNIQHTL